MWFYFRLKLCEFGLYELCEKTIFSLASLKIQEWFHADYLLLGGLWVEFVKGGGCP